ncbi:MAG: fasciclin domain-containing protein, partial [Dysgonamonadaceae bacterium]|nr:fasciclin domain-containing protein [Dysgonamonadaceae bacterium]
MKHSSILYTVILFTCFLAVPCFHSCTDMAEENITTYQEDLITSFLEKNPEQYSEFLELMYATGVAELLNAYGNYTCFIPNNTAMRDYYELHNIASSADMTAADRREFVYDHIISAKNVDDVYLSSRFPQARL